MLRHISAVMLVIVTSLPTHSYAGPAEANPERITCS